MGKTIDTAGDATVDTTAVDATAVATLAEVAPVQEDTEPTYTLLRPHTHDGVEYAVGHEFKASDWGLTDKQIGWMQGIGTI